MSFVNKIKNFFTKPIVVSVSNNKLRINIDTATSVLYLDEFTSFRSGVHGNWGAWSQSTDFSEARCSEKSMVIFIKKDGGHFLKFVYERYKWFGINDLHLSTDQSSELYRVKPEQFKRLFETLLFHFPDVSKEHVWKFDNQMCPTQ